MSNSNPKWNYHVFLSFRGEDTRKGFTDHLYAALCRKGIKVFRDDEELERGEVISTKLLEAIENSHFAIVIISKNYASSSWCLDELQKILASKHELGQEVLPIFYGVDPSDVRHQRGGFAEAFTNHEEKFREGQEKVLKWRNCFTEVANLSGWDSKDRHEAELIEDIVQAVWGKLRSKLPSYNDTLVGIDSRLDAIDLLLRIGLNDVRFVGIWGMGGIGKTTLASIVYERLLKQFETCCFLSNIREFSEIHDSLVHLQSELLSRFNVKGMVIENTYHGKKIIFSHLCNKKVLLVLDDVSSINQLENLAGSEEWFGTGSRIIITTRNLHLLKSHGVHEIYQVEILKREESLQLFCNKAFRMDQPQDGYLKLSESVVNYAGGLPLALKVLGSTLFGRSISEWEETLDKLKVVPNDILKILKISYDGLDDEEKTIFLDIACFFKSWNRDEVIEILKNCGLRPKVGIKVLIERSLLNDSMCMINMHDLIEEMGRIIVFQESPNDASKRSRLWSMKDINQVLRRNKGSKAIQGVLLRERYSYKNLYNAHWDPEAFSNMCNLRLLIISSNVYLPFGLKCISSALKVLHWREYPLKTLPPQAQLDELVDLKMKYSKIEELLTKRQCLENLKFLDLSYSTYLSKTPNFSRLPNLERLTLKGCVNLVELHPSLGQHKKLFVLNLSGCLRLKVLPRRLEMTSLKEFVLCGCSQVRNLPEFGENMKNLVILDAGRTVIAKLPESIGLLNGLEALNLRGCKNLICLPHSILGLKRLKSIDIYGCSKFSRLPENLNECEALEMLDASETAVTEVPSCIGHLEKLKTLSFHGCKGSTSNSWILPLPFNLVFKRHSIPKGLILPTCIFSLKSLRELDLSYCNIDDGIIPDDLGGLSSLRKLDLRGNMFVNLSAGCIFNLLNLEDVILKFCPRLRSLPLPPPCLVSIDAGQCASMEPLSDEQLFHLFSSNDQHGEHADRVIKLHGVSSLSLRDFTITIPGTKIPSWFENRRLLVLDEQYGDSIIMDVPPWEWLGFGLCLMLDDMFYSGREIFIYVDIFYKAPSGELEGDIATYRHCILEKGIKSPHLWMLFGQIKETNGLKLSVNYSHLHLTILTLSSPTWDGRLVSIIKCGWRVGSKAEIEEWGKTILKERKEGENGTCSEAEEQGQCSSSKLEGSQTITNECETMPPQSSSPCLEESELDDSWMQFISDDARFWF